MKPSSKKEMTMKLVLTGHYANKTVVLNGHKFVDGVLEINDDISKLGGLISYFRTYSAFLAGSDELAAAQARDKENANGDSSNLDDEWADASGVSTDKSGSEGEPGGSGHAGADSGGVLQDIEGDGVPPGRETRDPQTLKIIDALNSLDPENDEFWTDGGLPTVKAVEHASGIVGIKRKEIESALPEFNRDAARAALII
jgi:hypothetical protein